MEVVEENIKTANGSIAGNVTGKVVLHTEDLSIGYGAKGTQKVVAKGLNLNLNTGQLVCLLGPNGAGKSTLMRTIAGIQKALCGQVFIKDNEVGRMKKTELAKKLSLVLTDKANTGNLSVYDIITLGRYPYLNWFGRLRDVDKKIIRKAVKSTGIEPFLHKNIDQLSDGEKQKVMIARALVQETPMIILDEPTAHLDLPNRVEVMRLLRKMTREDEKSILLSTHELDLALQAADTIWLFMPDGSLSIGAPEDLILNGTFEKAFKRNGFDFDKISGTFKVNQPDGRKRVAVKGGHVHHFWTRRALEREGYFIDEKAKIEIIINEMVNSWTIGGISESREFSSIKHLTNYLKVINPHDNNKNNKSVPQ